MKKRLLYTLLAPAALLFAGCDYNEDNFGDVENPVIENVTVYEGAYTGDYPEDGYFTYDDAGRTALTEAVADMLGEMFLASDAGSTASVTVNVGTVTPGMERADISYTLTTDDYDSMGEGDGQPGDYNNFDGDMDVDQYLTAFCASRYASEAEGTTVSITYVYYAGGTSNRTNTYQKQADGSWTPIEMNTFVADNSYTLQDDDYDSMGTESGQPGRYNNFDSNMDVDFYLPIFLSINFPYVKDEGATFEVYYAYYSSGETTTRSATYFYNGTTWIPYDPYLATVVVTPMVAEMSYDGNAWLLDRLTGGSMAIAFSGEDYQALYQWVAENEAGYLGTRYPDTEEYYFGASTYYGNINNSYSTWRQYYNVNGEYDGLTDEQLQAIMDERLAWGIATLVLPLHVDTPNPDLSYVVTYTIYGGRGSGDYSMTFMYDEEAQAYELVAGPVAAQ